MKIRSEINKKKRFSVKLFYLGFGVFIFFSLLSIRYGKPMFSFLGLIGLVGFATGIFGVVYSAYAIKCRKCRQGWGYMALYGAFSLFLRGLNFVHSADIILTLNFSDLAYRYALFLTEIITPRRNLISILCRCNVE